MTAADSLLDELDAVVGSVALHLRTRDVARGAEVLAQVAEAVGRTVGDGVLPPRISPVAPLPEGPIVRLDDLPTDPLTRRRIADIVDDLVADAGFERGAAVLCEVDGLADLDECPRAVVLRLFPDPRGSAGQLPTGWIDLAGEWVFGDQDPETMVRLRVLGVEAEVMAKEAAGILHGCARARAWCDVVTGDVTARVRTASISFGIAPHVAVAAGGPRCDEAGLRARYELLAEVARDHAAPQGRRGERFSYACIDFEDTFGDLGTGLSNAPWADEQGASPNRVVGRLADQRVPEVFPFQVLGPRHVEALGDASRALHHIGDDRWELSLGDPVDWMPAASLRDELRREGWELLAPLLVTADELDVTLGAATTAATATGGVPDRPEDGGKAWTTGLPDLATVVIEAHSHPRRGSHLSVLELAAWLAGEPHTDDPVTVSPVLRVYVRELAAGVDGPLRQSLRDRASGLAGTGRFDAATERRRSWLLADRLVRLHAATWLSAAGLTESADRLRQLGPVSTDTQLVRGVHLLGSALGTASRRLEATREIAGDRSDAVDALAWDVWEVVCQRTGGAATAEAVVHGVPGALTFATDQRVMELSRDPQSRAELESSTRGLSDEVWSTALAEVAAAAWRTGWQAAEALVHHESTFSLRTTLRRTLQGIVGDDDIALDMLLDDVDAAARDTIARLLLVGDDQSDHWDRAMTACAAVEGGADWVRAVGETRAVLGPSLCDEAIQTARDQVRRWAMRAPELVSRAVVASVTREACSVAGRGVIARAVAATLARGASHTEAEAAGLAAVEPLALSLGADAVAVLDQLIDLDG